MWRGPGRFRVQPRTYTSFTRLCDRPTFKPLFQNASPLDDIAPDEDRRLYVCYLVLTLSRAPLNLFGSWCTSLRDRWGLTLASFYQPLVPI